MMRLLQPLGLVALVSLLLPLAIHLMRRADRTVLEFAALRFLNERRHPRREWQLRERILLALRLLLLVASSLLLAVPVWLSAHDTRAHWLAVASGVDDPASTGHRLSPATSLATLASQLRELDAQLPLDTQLEVMVPEELGGLDAERMRLTHTVLWQIVAGKTPAAAANVTAPVPATATPLAIALRADQAGDAELPVAHALLSAWNTVGPQALIDESAWLTPLPEGTRWLVWLGGPLSAAATDWVKRGGRALVTRDPSPLGAAVLSDDRGTVMFRERRVGRGRILSTHQPLTLAAMPGLRDAALAERLQSLLAASLQAPDRARASDVAPLPAGFDSNTMNAGSPLTEYAAALAAMLYVAERLWATRAARAGNR